MCVLGPRRGGCEREGEEVGACRFVRGLGGLFSAVYTVDILRSSTRGISIGVLPEVRSGAWSAVRGVPASGAGRVPSGARVRHQRGHHPGGASLGARPALVRRMRGKSGRGRGGGRYILGEIGGGVRVGVGWNWGGLTLNASSSFVVVFVERSRRRRRRRRRCRHRHRYHPRHRI